MKKLYYFLLIIIPSISLGQSTSQNFVKTTIYKQPNSTSVSSPAPSVALVKVTYFDGLGRPIQKISNQMSASGKDIIEPIVYNAFGFQTKDYLNFPSSGTTMAFDAAAVTNVSNYSLYTGQTPYRERKIEESPLNRVMSVADEGTDWDMPSLPSDPDHTLRYEYQNNTVNDQVKLYKATATWNATKGLYEIALVNASGTIYHSANQLNKTVIKSQNWKTADLKNNTVEEFRNKDGQVVLKRNYNNSIAHDTYYVYDQFGNLTYMLPPLLTDASVAAQMDGLCYQYKYDYRNRIVEKKLPAKQWQFFVYDKLNRLVATGPKFSPFSDINSDGWLIEKYDTFNRQVYSGWQQATVTSITRKTMQDAQNALATTLNETRQTSGTIDNIAAYYSNVVAPTTFKLLSVKYYDNYTFPDVASIPTTVETQTVLTTTQVKNMPTGGWTRVLTTSSSLSGETASVFYDSKARQIQLYLKNYLGGYTQIDKKLDFAGIEQYTIKYHKRLSSDTAIKITDNYAYTAQNRLLTHTHQIGTGTAQLLNKNDYNEIGQLVTKKVGGTDTSGATGLQTVNYSYNMRGWLTGINNDATNNLILNTTEDDLFAFKINYNTVQNETGYTGTELYNGNISETYWRSKSDNVMRKYGYNYDHLNRLTNAIYQKPGTSPAVPNSYNESLSYDKNGNITTLLRNGNSDGVIPAIAIDNLSYTYDPTSNKLLKVADTPASATSGFADGVNVNDDYTYDLEGNITSDQNKGIYIGPTTPAIIYNHLNLPIKITFGATGNTIQYVYTAAGQKLKKIVTVGATVTETDYLSGFQYKGAALQFFATSEGYVGRTTSGAGNAVINGVNTFNYVFQYKDHLGNVRVSYTKNNVTGLLDIIDENHFYPFGLKHSGYNTSVLLSGNNDAQKYKFEEQERQDELGLNLDNFKYRNYDYAIGRFMSVDPLSEKYNWQANYSFCSNQVVHSRELEGLEADDDFNYEDGDDHDWNAGIVGIEDHTGDPNFTPVGFDNNWTNDPNDMFPKDGMLDEVVVTGDKSAYDKFGQIDKEDEERDREDRDRNEKALEEMANTYQNIGTIMSLTGAVLCFTGIGAPIGAALMAAGTGLSAAGATIEFAEDALDEEDGIDWGNHAMNLGTALVPELYESNFVKETDDFLIGGDQLMMEVGAEASDAWMDFMTELHSSK
jgi:RHS repeat-associated protein